MGRAIALPVNEEAGEWRARAARFHSWATGAEPKTYVAPGINPAIPDSIAPHSPLLTPYSPTVKEIKRSVMETTYSDTEFINFLQDELAIPASEIAVVLRHRDLSNGPLPMLLWQYGLVSLEQLSRIFDWLESQFKLSK